MSFRNVAPLFLIVVADMMAMMMMVPVLPFLAERFGAGPLTVGLLAASFALCQLLAAPWLGRWSDRIGRRPVLLLSQFGTLVGLLVLARADSLWLLFLGRMLDGATAGNLSIAQACLADSTPPKDRARAFGILGAAFGIGLVFGPALSASLVGWGWSVPFYVAAGFSTLSLLATFLLLKPVVPLTESTIGVAPSTLTSLLSRREWRPLWIQFGVFALTFGFFSQGLGLFLERALVTSSGAPWGPKEVGAFFAVSGVFGIVIQGFLMGRLTQFFGEVRLASSAFLFSAAGYLLLGFSRTVAMACSALVLFSIGNSLLRPVLTSMLSQRASAKDQGQVLGTVSSLQSLGMVVGPLIGGAILQNGRLAWWAIVLALLSLLARFNSKSPN